MITEKKQKLSSIDHKNSIIDFKKSIFFKYDFILTFSNSYSGKVFTFRSDFISV